MVHLCCVNATGPIQTSDFSAPPQGARAWLQLLRVPNLFTVPGDPLVGYSLGLLAAGGVAGGWGLRAVLAAVASLLLYAGGLIQNDCYDLAEDMRDRPSRPLAAGLIRPGVALAAAVVLLVLGAACAFLASVQAGMVAAGLLVAITAYNGGIKRVAVLGPMLMGACRGLSLLLGAAALGAAAMGAPAVLIAAAGLTAYIAVVTFIASRETKAVRLGAMRFAPAAALAAWFVAIFITLPKVIAVGPVSLGTLAVLWSLACGFALGGVAGPAVVPPIIGRLIRGLLLVQAAWLAASPATGLAIAVVLIICWPISQMVAKRFYMS